jgi:predicted transcriptional regulator
MHELVGTPSNETALKARAPRRALLDLAPLELDCMNTLWPMGQGTVRDIRDRLAERLPRAYTTIMTIMDRLARKGIVDRQKVNRAYVYRPNLTAEQARSQALAQVLSNFFGGSREALLAHLGAVNHVRAAAAGASTSSVAAHVGGTGGTLAPFETPSMPVPVETKISDPQ